MKRKFTVLSCNQSNEGKTFVWKLQTEAEVTMFGLKKNVKRTYYIGGMPSAVEVGTTFEEDITKFEIVERDFTVDETGEVLRLKWLHAKVV